MDVCSKNNKRLLIFLVVAIVGGSLLFFKYIPRNSDKKYLLDQKQTYENLAREYPDDYSVFNQLAMIYLSLEKQSKAIEYAQKSIFLEERIPENWNVYGIVLYTAYQKASETKRKQLLPEIQHVGEKLFVICISQKKQLKDNMSLVEYLINSMIFLTTAGENEKANEVQELALKVAKEWKNSESPEKKRWGQIYVRQLQREQNKVPFPRNIK